MRWYRTCCLLILGSALASGAAAQATGTPSYNAPYRAFRRSEFGAVLSFPNGGGTAFEGAYRVASGKFDLGFRGGIFTPGGSGNSHLLVGAEARERVVTHTEDFPLDGALIVGIGGEFASGSSALIVPVGLSLGRRVDPRDSKISIVPYVQPTGFFVAAVERRTFSSRSAWAPISACRRVSTRASARDWVTWRVCHLAPCGCIRTTRIDLPDGFSYRRSPDQ